MRKWFKESWGRSHFRLLVLWAGPGAILSFALKDWLPWTAFMSWYAIVVTHAGADKASQAKIAAEGSNEAR